eukprot:scaffold51684_cov72-Phaeocystis_antarctica.AAC.4
MSCPFVALNRPAGALLPQPGVGSPAWRLARRTSSQPFAQSAVDRHPSWGKAGSLDLSLL